MEINNDQLEKIFEETATYIAYSSNTMTIKYMQFEDFVLASEKILALGKPRPLTKNKQTGNSFWCDKHFELGIASRCGLECVHCRNLRLENECRDATSR